jgi:hypothetical protein
LRPELRLVLERSLIAERKEANFVQNLKLQVNQAAPNITMPKIDIPTPVVNVEVPRPNGWRFEFVRGKDGLVESIRATPE